MKATGIVRRIDDLGRVVIPKEIRKTLRIKEGTPLEIFTDPASVVVPIDKLSILVTIAFSYIVFHEKLSLKSGTGLLLIVVGTLALLI